MIHQRLIVIPFFYSILRVLQTRALNIPTKNLKRIYENSLMEIDIQTIIIINSLKKKKEKNSHSRCYLLWVEKRRREMASCVFILIARKRVWMRWRQNKRLSRVEKGTDSALPCSSPCSCRSLFHLSSMIIIRPSTKMNWTCLLKDIQEQHLFFPLN